MTSPLVSALRSVAIEVPDLAKAEDFYTQVWRLQVVACNDEAIYLRGSGAAHHLLALHRGGPIARIRHVTLQARSVDALAQIARNAPQHGGRVIAPLGPLAEPAGGMGLTISDGDGRRMQIVYGDVRHDDIETTRDTPIRLAHVVLNSHDVAATQHFFEQVLAFSLSDRTRIMAFMNCNADHHSIALGDADNDALNHIAFLMPDVDAVMRGGGRMRDAGHGIEWGPGRHGPGNNAFNYFIDPFNVVIEYTAEVEQIDATYKTGSPDDWKWPAGRVDQWGISAPPSARLKEAQRSIFFVPTTATF